MKSSLVLIVATLTAAAGLWSSRSVITGPARDFLCVSDSLAPADLIQVLGGGPGRVPYALQLYREGFGKKLFFSGYTPDHNPGARFFHESANSVLRQGVRAEDILDYPSAARSTRAEAEELREILAAHPEIRRVLIVTSAPHTRRASWLFRHAVGSSVDLRMASVPGTARAPRKIVAQEYIKLAYNGCLALIASM